MAVVANATYTAETTVSYKKGNNYSSGAPNSTKQTNNEYNYMYGYDKTSWTTPKSGVVELDNTGMTGMFSVSSVPTQMVSMAIGGTTYNVNIYGQVTQIGTDTMKYAYDVD